MSIQTPFPVLGGGVLHLLGRRFWVVMSTEGVNLVSGLPLFNLEPTSPCPSHRYLRISGAQTQLTVSRKQVTLLGNSLQHMEL